MTPFGETRYDLSKFRVQILVKKGYQLEELEGVYQSSRDFVAEVLRMNEELMSDWVGLSSTVGQIKVQNEELIVSNKLVTGKFNDLSKKNFELKQELRRTKNQRNWLIGGAATVSLITLASVLSPLY